jgi:hypothetical protein
MNYEGIKESLFTEWKVVHKHFYKKDNDAKSKKENTIFKLKVKRSLVSIIAHIF